MKSTGLLTKSSIPAVLQLSKTPSCTFAVRAMIGCLYIPFSRFLISVHALDKINKNNKKTKMESERAYPKAIPNRHGEIEKDKGEVTKGLLLDHLKGFEAVVGDAVWHLALRQETRQHLLVYFVICLIKKKKEIKREGLVHLTTDFDLSTSLPYLPQ